MHRRPKVVIAAGYDLSLLRFRGELLKALVSLGWEVVAIAPPETTEVPDRLAVIGVRFRPIKLMRTGVSPWGEFNCRKEFHSILADERPDVYLGYTIKPVVHGLPAAHLAGIPTRIALVTGLGAAFNTGGLKGWVLFRVAALLYRRALRLATKVVVQNPDIARFFETTGIFRHSARMIVVQGSGVDTDEYAFHPTTPERPVFLLLARLLKDKGILEYADAARQVRTVFPDARFLLVGSHDSNPAAIEHALLQSWVATGAIEYHTAVEDVRPFLKACSIYVLPSYHEGLPRSVLEAMSVGRAVITTDAIGCRDTIVGAGLPDEQGIRVGSNGLLVPPRDAQALAAAMLRLIRNPKQAAAMGCAGRKLAEERFSVRRINQQMLGAMGAVVADVSNSP